jgi:hypothetical protein
MTVRRTPTFRRTPRPPTFSARLELQAAGGYLRIVAASKGAIDVPGCPDLRLDLDALWARVARLADPPAASKVTRLRKTAKKAPRR